MTLLALGSPWHESSDTVIRPKKSPTIELHQRPLEPQPDPTNQHPYRDDEFNAGETLRILVKDISTYFSVCALR